jgi:hypothetical protein
MRRGELEDVADGGAAPSVQGLVLVADDAQVSAGLAEAIEEAFLDVVGVLVLVDHHVTDRVPSRRSDVRIIQEVEEAPLNVGEVHTVLLDEDGLIRAVRAPELLKERGLPMPSACRHPRAPR